MKYWKLILTMIAIAGLGYYFPVYHLDDLTQTHRGDKLELVNLPEYLRQYYEGCTVIYIDRVATDDANVIFTLMRGCKNHPDHSFADIVNSYYIRGLK